MNHPDNFLNLLFHDFGEFGDDLVLCAGFERGKWRKKKQRGQVLT